MNIHKKLLKMGFKVCAPHKLKDDEWREPKSMVLDEIEVKSQYINGKW